MRFISSARQRGYLLCVFIRTHDKQALCRASKNTRQRSYLPKTHGKDLVCRAFYPRCMTKYFVPTPEQMKHQFSFFKKTFAVRFFLDARQTHEFGVRFLSCARKKYFFTLKYFP
jgi:hypothetical protein